MGQVEGVASPGPIARSLAARASPSGTASRAGPACGSLERVPAHPGSGRGERTSQRRGPSVRAGRRDSGDASSFAAPRPPPPPDPGPPSLMVAFPPDATPRPVRPEVPSRGRPRTIRPSRLQNRPAFRRASRNLRVPCAPRVLERPARASSRPGPFRAPATRLAGVVPPRAPPSATLRPTPGRRRGVLSPVDSSTPGRPARISNFTLPRG